MCLHLQPLVLGAEASPGPRTVVYHGSQSPLVRPCLRVLPPQSQLQGLQRASKLYVERSPSTLQGVHHDHQRGSVSDGIRVSCATCRFAVGLRSARPPSQQSVRAPLPSGFTSTARGRGRLRVPRSVCHPHGATSSLSLRDSAAVHRKAHRREFSDNAASRLCALSSRHAWEAQRAY